MSNSAMFELDHITYPDALCIPSLGKTISIEVPSDDSFEFGRMLELQSHLLEHVFKFAESADLRSASLVNPVWEKLAKRELQKRCFSTWISCRSPRSACKIDMSPEYRYSNAAICLIIYCSESLKLGRYICLHDDEFHRMTFADYIEKEVVPDKTEYCTISCREVAPSNIESKNVMKVFYQAITIPFIPKIRSTMFYYSPKKNIPIQNYVRDTEQVKCVLVFSQRYRVNMAETFFFALLKGQNPKKVAMGGGLIKGTKTFRQKNVQKLFRVEDLFCIAFLQEEGIEADFNAYSIVIPSYEDERFEVKLLRFKETSVLRQCGLIFRFCCFAKLSHEEETAIIEKHFPKYPLLGLEVDGEIGWNSLNVEESNTEQEIPPKSKRFKAGMPKSLHGWTTILVLITWGKKL